MHLRRFNRTSAHRRAMFRNIVSSLIQYERIETTLPKAKDLRRIADQMITLGKQGDRNAKKQALSYLKDPEITIPKLFGPLSARFADRPGGYTRVIPLGRRYGDNAPMAVIEYVDGPHDLQFEGVVRQLAKEHIDAKAGVTKTEAKATKSEADATKSKAVATKATKSEAATKSGSDATKTTKSEANATKAGSDPDAQSQNLRSPTRIREGFFSKNKFFELFYGNQFLKSQPQTLDLKRPDHLVPLQNEAAKEEVQAAKQESEPAKEEAKEKAKSRAEVDKRVKSEVVKARWAKKVEKVKKARGLNDEGLEAEVAKEVDWLTRKQEKTTVNPRSVAL